MDQPRQDPSNASGPGPAPCQVTSLSLLERVRAHDPEAWRRLVRLYQPLLLAWCARGGVNATDIEDRATADVARELNMTANNVRQARSRVLRRLREEVGDLLD